jgi:hypothetical protein
VATAGDVNGDGYADVIVGIEGYSSGRGGVYAYHGGASGLNSTPTFSATGENIEDNLGRTVATAGDVNGDGFADILAAAGDYPGNGYRGKVYLHYGSHSGGRLVLARQKRGDGSDRPVQPWGVSHNDTSFKVQMTATDPLGRNRVKLQIEACPPARPFEHADCVVHTGANWTDVTTSTTGVTLAETISGLTDTVYRWRARVLYAPYNVTQPGIIPPPNPAHGPWRRFLGQTLEADLRIPNQTQPPAGASVHLPIILKSEQLTYLYVKSVNTGGINPVEIRDPNDGDKLLLSCVIGNNITQYCGSFAPIGTYKIIAYTANCSRREATFSDATAGATVTREVYCN